MAKTVKGSMIITDWGETFDCSYGGSCDIDNGGYVKASTVLTGLAIKHLMYVSRGNKQLVKDILSDAVDEFEENNSEWLDSL